MLDDTPRLYFETAAAGLPKMNKNKIDIKKKVTEEARAALESFFRANNRFEIARPSRPMVSILLVLYNRAELTLGCLRSLQPYLHNMQAEIVIVDNASRDETDRLLDCIDGATIIRNSHNLGYAEGVNLAAAAAAGEYLLLLNNDTKLLSDSLQAAANYLSRHSDVGAVGGRIVLLDGTLQEAGCTIWREGEVFQYGRGDDPESPEYLFERDVDYCSGAFLMTRRELFEKMGGLDKAFVVGYFEDIDYCVRLWRAGWRVVYLPDVEIIHYENGSSDNSSCVPDYYRRNHLYFTQKHADWLIWQCPSTTPRLWARGSHDDRFRILYLPRRESTHNVLSDTVVVERLCNMNCFVTVCPIGDECSAGAMKYPSKVEVLTGVGLETLPRLLEERRDYYNCLIATDSETARFAQRCLRRGESDV